MTAPSGRPARTGHRGGDHGLSRRRRGARHEGPRGHLASAEWAAHLTPGRRHSRPESAQHPPPAAALWALRLWRAVGWPSADALAQAGPRRRGRADAPAVRHTLSRLQCAPLRA